MEIGDRDDSYSGKGLRSIGKVRNADFDQRKTSTGHVWRFRKNSIHFRIRFDGQALKSPFATLRYRQICLGTGEPGVFDIDHLEGHYIVKIPGKLNETDLGHPHSRQKLIAQIW